VTIYWLDDRGAIPGRVRNTFLFATTSRAALGPTQPPYQMGTEVLIPRGKSDGTVKLTFTSI
jgi:hypothetical protein